MIKIYVDGASKGNPGPGGSGVVAYDSKNNTILQSYSQYYENITNFQDTYEPDVDGEWLYQKAIKDGILKEDIGVVMYK